MKRCSRKTSSGAAVTHSPPSSPYPQLSCSPSICFFIPSTTICWDLVILRLIQPRHKLRARQLPGGQHQAPRKEPEAPPVLRQLLRRDGHRCARSRRWCGLRRGPVSARFSGPCLSPCFYLETLSFLFSPLSFPLQGSLPLTPSLILSPCLHSRPPLSLH